MPKSRTPVKDKISINVKNYFEGSVYYLGWMMLVSSVLAVFVIWFVGLILAFLGIMIVSSHFKLVVDPKVKKIDDYLSIFWLKSKHEQFTYHNLKHVIINSAKFKQQLNYKSISSSVSGTIYSAYLICDDQKHFLGDTEDAEKLRNKVQAFADQLGVPVKDHSRAH